VTGARPTRLVAVLGTGTEVGKTWVAARLLEQLRAGGATVAARKPAQSAELDDPAPSDAEVLAGATGEDPLAVCPAHRRYGVAMAPPMAAATLGRPPFTVADLAAEVLWPDRGPESARSAPSGTTGAGQEPGVDVGLVETAGGVLSPAAADGTSLDLARALGPDTLLLVADAGLGTINGVRLGLAALGPDGAAAVVVLNRYDPADPLHRANREVLEGDGLDVVVDLAALARRLQP